MSECKNIFVTGDFLIDHHIYEGERYNYGDMRSRGVQEIEETGGAALIHYLLSELENGIVPEPGIQLNTKENRRPILQSPPKFPPAHSAYAIWKPFLLEKGKSSELKVWRTTDAMGFGEPHQDGAAFDWTVNPERPPKVIVISDGGMGFRSQENLWPNDKFLKKSDWIVLKTTRPLAEGPLWEKLSQPPFCSKLVVILTSAELHRSAAAISSGLSWDATLESVFAALEPDAPLEALTRCSHLLMTFGMEGGLWLDLKSSSDHTDAHFVYETNFIEGEHIEPDKGTAFGMLSCLTASVARRLAEAGHAPDIESALEDGLSAIYDLLKKGHGPASIDGAGFPAARLAEVFKNPTCRYARAVFYPGNLIKEPECPYAKKIPRPNTEYPVPGSSTVPQSKSGRPCWSIMHEALRQQGYDVPKTKTQTPPRKGAQGLCAPHLALALAERVAKYGPIALGSLPHLSIGALMSADRNEIESLRILRRLITRYKELPPDKCKKPLSIGIFGPPGSGKSFAVQQIAKELIGKEGWLEFNLSQFKDGTGDLIGAFHQIRDRVLRNQVPVAFFDEFDSRQYGWLQYLLAPMQDGAFQEGQITHPIGKSLFVFAGSSSHTFDSFGPPQCNEEEYKIFKMAKGPDFMSRLDGFLDVPGPNQREVVQEETESRNYRREPDPCDVFYPLRRAFILRAQLGCDLNEELEMDPGLLRALLNVNHYAHGSRSISKIIDSLKTSTSGKIYRSQLPPSRQLGLHVSVHDFLKKCRPLDKDKDKDTEPLPEPKREILAKTIHETWRALAEKEGWLNDDNDVDYKELADFHKNSNRAAADRMNTNLSLIGLQLRESNGKTPQNGTLRMKIEYNLELLAKSEHDGWMEWLLDHGWQYGTEKGSKDLRKEPEKLTHPCLLPYLKLNVNDRNKDRDTIRHYPDFAHKAGMVIVPIAN